MVQTYLKHVRICNDKITIQETQKSVDSSVIFNIQVFNSSR